MAQVNRGPIGLSNWPKSNWPKSSVPHPRPHPHPHPHFHPHPHPQSSILNPYSPLGFQKMSRKPKCVFCVVFDVGNALTTNTNQRNSWKTEKYLKEGSGKEKKPEKFWPPPRPPPPKPPPARNTPTRLGSCLWAHPSWSQPFGPPPIRSFPSLTQETPQRSPPETPEPRRRPHLDPQGGGVGWRGSGSGWKCPKGGFEGGALKGGFEGGVLALSGKKRKT